MLLGGAVAASLTFWSVPNMEVVLARPQGRTAPVLLAKTPADMASRSSEPALPSTLGALSPLTATLIVRRQSTSGRVAPGRRIVTRTADRLHVTLPDRREWLFERNPADPQRVSALLTDHTARVIVVYEESELRNWEGIRGWADVATFGVDLQLLPALRPTSLVRTRAGLRFEQLTAVDGATPVREVWWNADHFLPISLTIATSDGTVSQVVESLRLDVETGVLLSPTHRFPGYRVADLADWLER
jgi:hypothetical protein